METIKTRIEKEHLFPYKWNLSDGYPAKGIEPNGLNIFGTFICGGGSTMGYKLAGFNHLGGVEIDKKVAEVYRINHNPKYLFVEDIREFNKRTDLPAELYNLDILDGSPPCSTFSSSGSREKDWGKEKVFREGQQFQTLDDLVFVYCDTIIKLQPKVFILENVKGIISGNAKSYSKKIVEKMRLAGYEVQVFLLNAASMGVPQMRERCFFIGYKSELKFPKLVLNFNETPIKFKEIKGDFGNPNSDHDNAIWESRRVGEQDFGATLVRIGKKESNWNSKYVYDEKVCKTIISTSGSKLIEFKHPFHLGNDKLKQIGSYPMDYDFMKIEAKYLIGMSVPPVMTAQIANQIKKQWFDYAK